MSLCYLWSLGSSYCEETWKWNHEHLTLLFIFLSFEHSFDFWGALFSIIVFIGKTYDASCLPSSKKMNVFTVSCLNCKIVIEHFETFNPSDRNRSCVSTAGRKEKGLKNGKWKGESLLTCTLKYGAVVNEVSSVPLGNLSAMLVRGRISSLS